MGKKDFFELIEQQGMVDPETINDLRKTVERIARRLARGESVKLPGVGKLIPQLKRSIVFQGAARQRKNARGGGR
jgi:nucleoid DNA-binding protein